MCVFCNTLKYIKSATRYEGYSIEFLPRSSNKFYCYHQKTMSPIKTYLNNCFIKSLQIKNILTLFLMGHKGERGTDIYQDLHSFENECPSTCIMYLIQCRRCDPVGDNVTWPRITLQKTHWLLLRSCPGIMPWASKVT